VSEHASAVVLAAPSGTGKTTLARRLVEEGDDYAFSVSATTRAPRAHERDGVDYHFVDRESFEQMVSAGDLAEWAEVHGRLYGTPRVQLDRAAEMGVHIVLDIDVQGAGQLSAAVPDTKLIFVLPPDVDTLLSRLRGRGTEEPAEVARRLRSALGELQAVENFDYVVVNDDLERCLGTIRDIVSGEVHAMGHDAVEHDAEEFRSEIRRVLIDDFSEYMTDPA
jgi:guanylate kinase